MNETLVVFAYAKAGLGHLRVTDALEDGLPKETPRVYFSSLEQSIEGLHKVTSTHPVLTRLMERAQYGTLEHLVSASMKYFLLRRVEGTYAQLVQLTQAQKEYRSILLVATHFGLAHQLASVKDRLKQETGKEVKLAVVVTDDSPQEVWYVPGADVIVTPSEETKRGLYKLADRYGWKRARIEVNPYPIHPAFGALLEPQKYGQKSVQVLSGSEANIYISVPISGASVGLTFTRTMLTSLQAKLSRTKVYIIARENPYSRSFLREMSTASWVRVLSSPFDRAIVDQYHTLYETEVIGYEITKPSEQAFKALVSGKARGGPILLFTQPVGRQEYDNLAFLRRHGLVPDENLTRTLWRQEESPLVCNMRGLVLPPDPTEAANFFVWCLKRNIFKTMLECESRAMSWDPHPEELGGDGVAKFWNIMDSL